VERAADGFPDVDLGDLGKSTPLRVNYKVDEPVGKEFARIECVVLKSELKLAEFGVNSHGKRFEKLHTASIIFDGKQATENGPAYVFGCPTVLVDGKKLPLAIQSLTIKTSL